MATTMETKLSLGLVSLSLLYFLTFIGSVPLSAAQPEELSSFSFLTKWGSEGAGSGQFMGQNDVDPFQNFVYVADYENDRIQVFDSNGTFVASWGGEGSGDGQIAKASALTVDHNGNIYLVDQSNFRIQKFDHNGNFISTWGSEGEQTDNFCILMYQQ
jgi:hypothetical protein